MVDVGVVEMVDEVESVDIVTDKEFSRSGEGRVRFGIVGVHILELARLRTVIYLYSFTPRADRAVTNLYIDELAERVFLKYEDVAAIR